MTFAMAFAPDGKRLVSGGLEGRLTVWDVATARELRSVAGDPREVVSVAVTPDGNHMISGGVGGSIKVWEIDGGKLVRTITGHAQGVFALAVGADGTRLVSAGRDKQVKLWDLGDGQLVRTFSAHTNEIRSIALDAKAERIASAGYDKTVRVWEAATGKELLSLPADPRGFPVVAIAGDLLIAAADNGMIVWELPTGKELRRLAGAVSAIHALAMPADGKSVVVGGADRAVKLWDIGSGRTVTLLGHTQDVRAVSVSGKTLVSGGDDGSIRVWDAASAKEVRSLAGHKGGVLSIDLTRDGKVAVSGGMDGIVRVWSVASGKEARALRHDHPVCSVAVSASGRLVASTSGALVHRRVADGREFSITDALRMWDLVAGRDKKVKLDAVAVAVSSDEKRVVAVTNGGAFHAWDVAKGEPVASGGMGDAPETPPTGSTMSAGLALTPDGRWAVTGGEDGGAHVWEVATGKKPHALKGHAGAVRAVGFTSNGRHVVTGGADGTVCFWGRESGRLVATLYLFPDGEWLVRGADGTYDASAGAGAYAGWRTGDKREPLEAHEVKRRVRGLAAKLLGQ